MCVCGGVGVGGGGGVCVCVCVWGGGGGVLVLYLDHIFTQKGRSLMHQIPSGPESMCHTSAKVFAPNKNDLIFVLFRLIGNVSVQYLECICPSYIKLWFKYPSPET